MLRSRYGIFILLYTLCIQLENASSEPIFKFVMKLDKIVLSDSFTNDTSCTDFDFILMFNKDGETLDIYKIDYWTLKHTILTFEPKIFQHNLLKGEDTVYFGMFYYVDNLGFKWADINVLSYLEGDINLDCHPCMSQFNEGISLYANISIKNINKAQTDRIVSIIYYDLFSKILSKDDILRSYEYNEEEQIIFMLNINSLTLNEDFIFSNQEISPSIYMTILKSDKFNELKDGMKLNMSIIWHKYEETKILWECNIEYNLSDSNNIRNIFYKELNYNGTSVWFKIETFSTNYGGKNLQYFCEFKNKNTICDENGKKICVRKYIKNRENCEKVDPCKVNPCKNNAICKSFSTNYECHCTTGYYGKMCESMLCNKNCIKCKAPYICEECKLGLIGDNCTIKTCQGYDCGKGDCHTFYNFRFCICKDEYFGEKCNDTCFDSCINGTCDFYNGYLYCKCDPGYIGINCNIRDSTYPIVYSKSDKFIYTLASITIIITFIIIIIFILLIRVKANNISDDKDKSSHFVTQSAINQTEMTNKGESSSVKTNVNELPEIMYKFNIYENLNEIVEKQELSEHNSEKDSLKVAKISTITDASKNIMSDTIYE